MKKKSVAILNTTHIRRRAEARWSARRQQTPVPPATEAETLRLIHELEMHQVELQMQNEELRRSRAELEAAYRQFTDLYDFAPVSYFMLGHDGTIRDVNLAGATLLGVERSLLIGQRLGLYVSSEYRLAFADFLAALSACESKKTCELLFQNAENALLWVRIDASCFYGGQECRAVLTDLTERKQLEQALQESEQRFRTALQEVPTVAVQGYAMDGTTQYWNDASVRLYGYSAEEALGQNLLELIIPPEMRDEVGGAIQQMAQTGQPIPAAELALMRKDGTRVIVYSSHLVVKVPGRAPELFCLDVDWTARKQAEEELRYLSTHDALTGLYNRTFFEDELARLEREREFPVSIIVADVNRLKEINDRFGHAAGDAALKRVAQVLSVAFRAEDIVARIGGDEFAVLLPGTGSASAEAARHRARQILREHNLSHSGFPIGIAFGVSTADTQVSLANVIKAADAHMYREKKRQK